MKRVSRNRHLAVRVSVDEKYAFADLAKRAGMKLGEWARELMLDELRKDWDKKEAEHGRYVRRRDAVHAPLPPEASVWLQNQNPPG